MIRNRLWREWSCPSSLPRWRQRTVLPSASLAWQRRLYVSGPKNDGWGIFARDPVQIAQEIAARTPLPSSQRPNPAPGLNSYSDAEALKPPAPAAPTWRDQPRSPRHQHANNNGGPKSLDGSGPSRYDGPVSYNKRPSRHLTPRSRTVAQRTREPRKRDGETTVSPPPSSYRRSSGTLEPREPQLHRDAPDVISHFTKTTARPPQRYRETRGGNEFWNSRSLRPQQPPKAELTSSRPRRHLDSSDEQESWNNRSVRSHRPRPIKNPDNLWIPPADAQPDTEKNPVTRDQPGRFWDRNYDFSDHRGGEHGAPADLHSRPRIRKEHQNFSPLERETYNSIEFLKTEEDPGWSQLRRRQKENAPGPSPLVSRQSPTLPTKDPFWELLEQAKVKQEKSPVDDFWKEAEAGVGEAPEGRYRELETETIQVEKPGEYRSPEVEIDRRPGKHEKKSKKKVGRRHTKREDEEDDYDEEWAEERRRRKEEKRLAKQAARTGPQPIFLPQYINVQNLAGALHVGKETLLNQLTEWGFENIHDESIMTGETASLIALEYGYEPTVDSGENRDLLSRPPPKDPTSLPLRPPVVTIMGHVDHGKTTILDYLRKSSIAAQEHGGITQHIGAFSVKLSSGKIITFLDTPGHAAFLNMRQRGANVTDIVVLVVAADDSVMPQTLEALKHAQNAKVPIIVAINKIDKFDSNVERVKQDLVRHGVEIEDIGGDVQVVPVSGKTGQGMSDLEENISLLSEVLDHRADPTGMAEGWVLESSLADAVGAQATVLVKAGTLRVGDVIVAGQTMARVRRLRNEAGQDLQDAPPGYPVQVLGWRSLPQAGDEVLQAPDEQRARSAIAYRQNLQDRAAEIAEANRLRALEEEQRAKEAARALAEAGEDGEAKADEQQPVGPKTVNMVVKADVAGSAEAVSDALSALGNSEVVGRVLRSSVGVPGESDVEHAAVTGATLVVFNVGIPGAIRAMAERAGVRIVENSVIYRLVENVKDVLSELLPDAVTHKVLGEAEVAQVFAINMRGRQYRNIAGCKVRNGVIGINKSVKVLRGGKKGDEEELTLEGEGEKGKKVVYQGKIDTLKHHKKDVEEMRKGTDCGVGFEDWDAIKEGDIVQTYEEIREKRHL